ncbi:MAG: molybdopterin molybdotransferase [Paraglaciecola sp.]|jgi:molybdopterin molybdotransferase
MTCGCDTLGLLPLEQAKQLIWQQINPISQIEVCPLSNAIDRVLAEDLLAPFDVPAFDNSAMDGYALIAEDLATHGHLLQIGKSFAGKPYAAKIKSGECVRIMTGAMLPSGADTVVMQENAQVQGANIRFSGKITKGDAIRRTAEEVAAGTVVLNAGRKLTTMDIGLLASLGINQIPLRRKLKVALVSTGDELVDVGQPLSEGKIYDGNRPALMAMLNKLNVEIIDFGIVEDDLHKLEKVFKAADLQADVVLTSGGVSVGEADYTKDVLLSMGQIHFWKLAIKPGKPLAYGQLPNSIFFGLPGNPVSAMVTFHQIVLPTLELISGKTPITPLQYIATATVSFAKKTGRTDFQRGICWTDPQQGLLVKSVGQQGSGMLSSMTKANCYVVLEQDRGMVTSGEKVSVLPFDQYLG